MNSTMLAETLKQLGLLHQNVAVHASLSSFGRFDGGAEAITSVLKGISTNLMMPAFSTDSIVRPPPNDRPQRNGCDYADRDYWSLNSSKRFDISTQSIDKRMGQIAQVFAHSPGAMRSPHPWHSWTAFGHDAAALVDSHAWNDPHAPLKRLCKLEGFVLLLGVDLRSCSVIHLAEERSGRRSFIRWALDSDGSVGRVAVAGCAAGFNNLAQDCRDLLTQHTLGSCKITLAPLNKLVDRCQELILSRPEITRCKPDCLRCTDMIAGGPLE